MDGKALCQKLCKIMTIIASDDHDGGWVDVLQYLRCFQSTTVKVTGLQLFFFFFFNIRNELCPQGLQAVRGDRFIINH